MYTLGETTLTLPMENTMNDGNKNEGNNIKDLAREIEHQNNQISELKRNLKLQEDENVQLKKLLSEYDLQNGLGNYTERLQLLENLQKNIWSLGSQIERLDKTCQLSPGNQEATISVKKKDVSKLRKSQEKVEETLNKYLKTTSPGITTLMNSK